MKRPLIVSRDPYISDVHEQLRNTSTNNFYNTGNFLFLSSISRLIRTPVKRNLWNFNPEKVRKAHDGLVIPAANWLQKRHDFSHLAALIEKTDMPTVIVGLGAQAAGDRIPELQKGTIRMMKAISDRCHSISVRGTFSAEVLNHYGVKNVTVTGCPSLLWHLKESASVTRFPKSNKPWRVSLNATVPAQMLDAKNNKHMQLAQFMMQNALKKKCDIVMQTEAPFLRIKFGIAGEADWKLVEYVIGSKNRDQIRNYLNISLKCFGNVPEWLAYAANRDMIIGTRLHGVVAGLLSGTPSVLITHDSRTEEMAKHASIPSISSDEIQARGEINAQELLERADFDAFNVRQRDYFKEFVKFFKDNEVATFLNLT